ncbi:glycosyl transferase [bacterium]|jgi:glycosyltransferase involved in cell wall biosynthesis|nr:glycosyl transferase [bacterium]MDP6571354.1 glycosyltransferase [Patescibacteria group bacterium]|tara:strand:- start:6163 stop:7254 length:1092 start_codon:yes stop_codon:yes gene_type:complete
MNVALVHDHLNQIGGAERVVLDMHKIWPKAPLYTLVHDKNKVKDFFNSLEIKTSFIQKLPLSLSHLRWYLSLMPTAVESFNLSEYDVILSSASAFGKGAIAPPNALHICYCHTPTRYLWSDAHTYASEVGGGGLIGKILPFVLHRLRMWDFLASQRVDYFIANSQFVADRIKRYYNRESVIMYPPVDTLGYPVVPKMNYFVLVSRLRPYKKVDIAIRAFNRLNMPLVIVGDGEERKNLEAISASNIYFTGNVDESIKKKLLAGALGFIHPQEEDAGIAAIEAMAAGTPVIAFDAGGARETIIQDVTGMKFEEQTWQMLADTVIRFKKQSFDYDMIRDHSQQFSRERFMNELKTFVDMKYLESR